MDQRMPDEILYHFPKHGRLSIHVGGYTRALADLFEAEGQLITRLKQTDQLGNLRYFYPGAHHTRYEYLLLQWYLLDRLAKAKSVSEPTLGLAGGVRDLPKREGAKPPTGVDVLQTAVLLANVGHLPETLAGERAVLAVLASDPDLRQAFQHLLGDAAPAFGIALQQFDPYGLHLYLAWLWLQQVHSFDADPQVVQYGRQVLWHQLAPDENPKWGRFQKLGQQVRRIAYLTLDTLYTPAPFSIEFGTLEDDLVRNPEAYMLDTSLFQMALLELNQVMRRLVYQSPLALLSMAAITRERVTRITRARDQLLQPDGWVSAIYPQRGSKLSDVLHGTLAAAAASDVDARRTVALELTLAERRPVWRNTVALEEAMGHKSDRRSRAACDWDASSQTLGIAFAPVAGLPANQWARVAAGFWQAVLHRATDPAAPAGAGTSSARALYLYALRAALGDRLVPAVRSDPLGGHPEPVFWGRRALDVAPPLRQWVDAATDTVHASVLHEVRVLAAVCEALHTRGPVLAYGGQTVLYAGSEERAELDGVILVAGDAESPPAIIWVEAKRPGASLARAQLENRLRRVVQLAVSHVAEVDGGAWAETLAAAK
ncbi:MAG: hypothetical protein M0Z54_03690 [Thermaerobacter sp.]|nr:hypothetical protein [Thermaerobacter sp.]